ncbi:MAG: nitrous oxide reductase family maturation protein NosD [Promethearchaeota archaeon]
MKIEFSINEDNLKISYFNKNKSPINIDGNSGWTSAAIQPWCTYNGGIYYIENLTIDGNGYEPCITISDSSVSFIIRNCTLYDADNGYFGGYGAISLSNVNNGKILNNNIYSNDINGIYLSNSDNNVIEKNKCSNNEGGGIYLSNSDNNVIKNNTCSNNENNGIYLYGSHDNTIEINTCSNNIYYPTQNEFEENGICLRNSDNNIIENNTCLDNGYNGIYLSNSDLNTIGNNTCISNDYNGIYLYAPDGYQCNINVIINNIIRYNNNNGLKFIWCTNTIIKDNICFSNSRDGIYIDNSHSTLIKNNNFISNSGSGISIRSSYLDTCYDNTIIKNTILTNDFYGIYLSSCKDFNISQNNIKSNGNGGIIFYYCNIISMNNNTIWDNIIEANRYGIYMYKTEYTLIFENNIRDNIEYGIFLKHQSSYNTIINNLFSNNGLYCICYEGECTNNVFDNFGCFPVNLDLLNENPEDQELPVYMLYSVVFLIFFIGIISGLSILSLSKRKRMREYGIEVDHRGSIFVRDGTNQFEQYELEKMKITTPIEVKPYEFFCFSCKKKSIGHEVFCPTCSQRMKLYDPSKTLVSPLKKEKRDQNKCILCFQSTCPTCNSNLIGENNCFEECPYCESVYHRHCWNKTIHSFGKCGFCLEPPPTELIPKDF